MDEKQALRKKVKILEMLFSEGYCTEKELQGISLEDMLKMKGITVPDLLIVLEIQKATKAGRLFSYLGGREDADSEAKG